MAGVQFSFPVIRYHCDPCDAICDCDSDQGRSTEPRSLSEQSVCVTLGPRTQCMYGELSSEFYPEGTYSGVMEGGKHGLTWQMSSGD